MERGPGGEASKSSTPEPHRGPVALLLLLLFFSFTPLSAATLAEETQALLNLAAVSGREEAAADFIAGRLAGLPVQRDELGNVVLALGSGEPRRLFSCSLGEPGLIVSGIREDGILRVVPAGNSLVGALWTQSFEGQTVMVGASGDWRAGVVVLPSVHLDQTGRGGRERPFDVEDLYIDVGAEAPADVAAMGIRLLEPVALIRRPSRMAGDLVAAPSAALKGSCVAMADAARRVASKAGTGTAVLAWTVSDAFNPAGLIHLAKKRGPFQEVIRMDSGFGWENVEGQGPAPKPLPAPGSGWIGAGALPGGLAGSAAPHVDTAAGVPWGSARVGWLGLPSRYPGTPVETVSLRDVQALSDALAKALGSGGAAAAGPDLSAAPAIVEDRSEHAEAADLLGSLVARYGVSGAEGPVRDEVRRHLPAWAKPETDDKGNLIVTVGSGGEPILFVAHMDEVGFRVEEVLPDGRLRLGTRGGLLPQVWEAQAALVHGDRGSVPAVFEPREDWWTATKWDLEKPLMVYLGVSSAKEAEALGIHAESTVTMPKRMLRLGPHRVTGRSFDDRIGSTALLLALRRIDPAKLKRRVIFAWSVEEEVGLNGATALAARFPDLAGVHPVDTFVSADSPVESRRFADARLGKGPVIRAMDNRYIAPRPLLDGFLEQAEKAGIAVQVGFTGGATDGVAFLPDGTAMLPFSWPGRYSHSPVEVADLRDIEALIRLVEMAARD